MRRAIAISDLDVANLCWMVLLLLRLLLMLLLPSMMPEHGNICEDRQIFRFQFIELKILFMLRYLI